MNRFCVSQESLIKFQELKTIKKASTTLDPHLNVLLTGELNGTMPI